MSLTLAKETGGQKDVYDSWSDGNDTNGLSEVAVFEVASNSLQNPKDSVDH